MQTKAHVYVRTTFEGYHRWADAPEAVAFLRHWHRHLFHVQLDVHVEHNDRDVEFFILQRELNRFIDDTFQPQGPMRFEFSCEMIAEQIIAHFHEKLEYKVHSCEVSEDGENGAVVTVAGLAEQIQETLDARESWEREQREFE